MCANDVLESGAEPVAFLDYIACGKLHVPLAAQIVKGISEGCREAKCALVGKFWEIFQQNYTIILYLFHFQRW